MRGLGILVASLVALGACGGEDDATKSAEKAVEKVLGSNDVELKGNSPLHAAAYAVVSVQKEKYSDYDIDGSTVRITVRDGVTLSGSECIIINGATDADHPDVAFILVESDGTETTC